MHPSLFYEFCTLTIKFIAMQKVSLKNRTWDVAGHLYFPENFDNTKQYPAIVCVHPGSSVKEQTAGLYASQLAKNGFITLTFDASLQGESGGEPRFLEDPTMRVEDVKCAVDYLTTLQFIDNERIGAFGVCAGGGYAANATISERRIKALATVVGTNLRRAFGEANPMETMEAVGKQRTLEANGGEALINNWIPNSKEDALNLGLNEQDLLGAIDYYRTSRGQHPNSQNKLLFTSLSNLVMFDAFHLAEFYLTQPLLVIVGDKVGGYGSYRDGYDLYNKAAAKNKKIHVVKDASHYDLYDQPFATENALEQIIPFFKENL